MLNSKQCKRTLSSSCLLLEIPIAPKPRDFRKSHYTLLTHPPSQGKKTYQTEKNISYLPICQQIHQLPAAYFNNNKHNRDHNTTQENNKYSCQVVHVKALCVASFGLRGLWALTPIIPPSSTCFFDKVLLSQLKVKRIIVLIV